MNFKRIEAAEVKLRDFSAYFWNTPRNNESLGPLRAKKIFIRKKLGHTAVSAIKASSVTL